MKNADFCFPTLEPTDTLKKIGGIKVALSEGYTVDSLITESGGVFSYEEDVNGNLVVCVSKSIGQRMQISVESGNPAVEHVATAELFVPVYSGNDFVGTRPVVKRPKDS